MQISIKLAQLNQTINIPVNQDIRSTAEYYENQHPIVNGTTTTGAQILNSLIEILKFIFK